MAKLSAPTGLCWKTFEGSSPVTYLPRDNSKIDLVWDFVPGAEDPTRYYISWGPSSGCNGSRALYGQGRSGFRWSDFSGYPTQTSFQVGVKTKPIEGSGDTASGYSYISISVEPPPPPPKYGISWIVWYNDRGIASNSSHAQAGTVELNGRSYTKCPYDTYEEGTQIELNFNLGENKFNRDFIPPTQPDYVNTGYSGPINDWLTFNFSVYGKVTVSFNTEESKIKVDPERIFYKENVYLSALKREDEKRSRKVTLDDQTGNPVTEILKEEKTHYEFEGWRIGPKDNPYIPGFSPPILKDTVFTEVWKPPEILPAYLTEEDLPKPIRQGYKLIGWFYDKEGKNPVDFMQELTQDITIYACWERTGNPIFIYTNSVWKQYMPKIYKNGMWQDCTAKLRLPSKWDE